MSQQVFEGCKIVIYSSKEWAQKQAVLQQKCAPIQRFAKAERDKMDADPSYEMPEVQWHEYEYSKDFLCAAGFECTGERTLVAVDDGHRRYAVKYVYWPLDEGASEMGALSEHVFDPQGAVQCYARGLSDFGARGRGKAERGKMIMFGYNAIKS